MKPRLSIGILFKNEIRCLERCLRSLDALRRAVPCEVVTVDTGSEDGSRAVAERYADVLIDFPWRKDFAAARNAVLARCTGEWYLTLDSDEWLDEAELDELVHIVTSDRWSGAVQGFVTVRNYKDAELTEYSDVLVPRLIRTRPGVRYEGAIHEAPVFPDPVETNLIADGVILHHDGYVQFAGARGRAKRQRNVEMLRGELKREPDSLRLLGEYLDVGIEEPDYLALLRRAVRLVLEQPEDPAGPGIFRRAIQIAIHKNLPELDEWTAQAEERYPDSIFIRIDVNDWLAFALAERERCAEALRRGEAYRRAAAALAEDAEMRRQMVSGEVYTVNDADRRAMEMLLALCRAKTGDPKGAAALLMETDFTRAPAEHLRYAMLALRALQIDTRLDTAPLVTRMWRELCRPEPSEKRMRERRAAFLRLGGEMFAERPVTEPERPSWTVFLPLAGECVLGDAAAMRREEDPAALTALLARQTDWAELPGAALAHALERGAAFPPAGCLCPPEEWKALADGLAAADQTLLNRLVAARARNGPPADWTELLWADAMACAAVRGFDWAENADLPGHTEEGRALAASFAAVERTALPRLYTAAALEDGAGLRPVHRVGWAAARAFAVSANGGGEAFARILGEVREDSGGALRDMLDFLLPAVKGAVT